MTTVDLQAQIFRTLQRSPRALTSSQIAAWLKAPLVCVIAELCLMQHRQIITARTCDGDTDQGHEPRVLYHIVTKRAMTA